MSTGVQKIERIIELMKELKKEILSLKKEQLIASEKQSLLDQEAQDIEHIIENYNLSGSESARLVSHFHKLRTERREAKNVDDYVFKNLKSFVAVLPVFDKTIQSWNIMTGKGKYQMKTERGHELLKSIVKNYETRSSFEMTPPLIKKGKKSLSAIPADKEVTGDVTILNPQNVFHIDFSHSKLWTLRNKSIQGSNLCSLNFSKLIETAFNHGLKPESIFTSSIIKKTFLNNLLETKNIKDIDETWMNKLENHVQTKIPDAPEQYNLYYSATKFALSDYNNGNQNIVTTSHLKELIKVIRKLGNKKKFKSNTITITTIKEKLELENLSSKEKEGIQYILANILE